MVVVPYLCSMGEPSVVTPFTPTTTVRVPRSEQDLETRMAKALAHPLRAKVLTRLNEGVASPNELSRELGEPLGNVSYHVKALLELGLHRAGRHRAAARSDRALLPRADSGPPGRERLQEAAGIDPRRAVGRCHRGGDRRHRQGLQGRHVRRPRRPSRQLDAPRPRRAGVERAGRRARPAGRAGRRAAGAERQATEGRWRGDPHLAGARRLRVGAAGLTDSTSCRAPGRRTGRASAGRAERAGRVSRWPGRRRSAPGRRRPRRSAA